MHRRGRWLGPTINVLVLCLVVVGAAPPAAAQEVERVQVRPLEGNATAWVPEDVFVELLSPQGYDDAACCEDSDSGEWDGPAYTTTTTGSTGTVAMIWDTGVATNAPTAEQASQEALVHGWAEIERGTVPVPHVVNGAVVGDIEGFYLITQCSSPTSCAQTEGVLAFPIGRGMFATVRFAALRPSGDDSVVAGGTPASDWHLGQVRIAIQQVSLTGTGTDGNDTGTGTSGADVVHLMGGDDTYSAAAGNDSVYGGAGNDELAGGAGNDLLDGGSNNDALTGGDGGDTLKGGGGNDLLTGDGPNAIARSADSADGDYHASAGGVDLLFGGGGRDRLIGGAGLDSFNGGPGSDVCIVDSRKEKRRAKSCETIRVRRGHL